MIKDYNKIGDCAVYIDEQVKVSVPKPHCFAETLGKANRK